MIHRCGKSLALAFVFIMFLPLFARSETGRISTPKPPFSPGEKLTYRGAWGPIQAGEVTLEVLPKEVFQGVEAYHFAMTTKTNAAVDLIYKIRERQESYVDVDLTRSLYYQKKTESKHPRDAKIIFDWEKLEATYSNFGEKRAPIKIMPGSYDPLAIFFVLRVKEFKENTVIEMPVTDGSMNIDVKATVAKKAMIKIGEKAYETFEVTPDMERLEKVVKKSDNPQLRIWFTADERKIPVKIQSRVGIVSFIFELQSGGS